MIDITEEKELLLRLEQARTAAENAAPTKSEFLANMSHEIRTPMDNIIGSIRLLLDAGVTAEQRDYLETIRLCGEALLELVDSILDVAKLEAGKLVLEQIPFDLEKLLNGTLSVIAPLASQRGLSLGRAFEPDLPKVVVGDPQRIRQILRNLLSNAVEVFRTRSGHFGCSHDGYQRSWCRIGVYGSGYRYRYPARSAAGHL